MLIFKIHLMVGEEFTKLFQNGDVDVVDESQPINKESVQGSVLQRIRVKELAELLHGMPFEDRHEWLLYQKQKGNRYFYEEQYDMAIQIYLDMAVGLHYDEDRPDRNQIMNLEFKAPLLYNLSMCYRSKKDYDRASQMLDKVIEVDPSPQQYLRRITFNLELKDWERALEDLKKIQHQCSKSEDLKRKFQEKMQLVKDIKDDEKRMSQKMLNLSQRLPTPTSKGNTSVHLQPDESPGSSNFESFYNAFKGLWNQIFSCRKLFLDEDSSDDDETDPHAFAHH